MSDEEILEAYALDSLRRELKRYSTIRKHAWYASIDRLTREELLALSLELTGDMPETSDSTPYIRWVRDTDAGRYLGNGQDRADRS